MKRHPDGVVEVEALPWERFFRLRNGRVQRGAVKTTTKPSVFARDQEARVPDGTMYWRRVTQEEWAALKRNHPGLARAFPGVTNANTKASE